MQDVLTSTTLLPFMKSIALKTLIRQGNYLYDQQLTLKVQSLRQN